MNKSPEHIFPKVHIKTFGCQMNEYDSLRMIQLLESHGFSQTQSYDDAAAIILNTCTVRKKAEDKVYSELGRINTIKKQKPHLIIGVGGCLAQQEGQNLISKYPYIDFAFGTKALQHLPHLLDRALHGKKTVAVDMATSRTMYPEAPYASADSQITAFVTIMQGCNNYCSYCIVPYVRGPEWSRSTLEIVQEVRHLVDNGIKEVTLLGQNVNSYGTTLTPLSSFSQLLCEVNRIKGLERIRFTTSHPKDLSSNLIAAFTQVEKLCEHIHLPLQSGSDMILRKMNRSYTRDEYRKKIDSLKKNVPHISLTSDIIVGFPGETEKDFMETLLMIQEICFDDLFIFHYTDRPGTKASLSIDNVPYEVKIERLRLLNDLQRKISLSINSRLIGETVSVLLEGSSKKGVGTIAGRTRTNKVVNCKGPLELKGSTVSVKIEKTNIHSLTGRIL
ncbi:MAG: tRNA (N6-isopentenyl adenosine(37)-C2)-methylthiotransferase MiaB [Pseudomonadota bacterium]